MKTFVVPRPPLGIVNFAFEYGCLLAAQQAEPEPISDPVLIDYRDASELLGMAVPRAGETRSQGRARGANSLACRVADGRVPSRLIRREGRRVFFIREALIEWASKGSK